MPEFFVELAWRCAACAKENLGRDKACAGCGKPKQAEAFVDRSPVPTPASAVTEPELLRQARAGPDWKCVFCGSRQRRDHGECASCGAAQPDGAAPAAVASSASAVSPTRPVAGPAKHFAGSGPAKPRKPRELAIPFVLAPIVALVGVVGIPVYVATGHAAPSIGLVMGGAAAGMVGAFVLFLAGAMGVGTIRLGYVAERSAVAKRHWVWTRRHTFGAIALGAAALVAAFVVLRPRVVEGTVVARTWRHAVEVEKYRLTDQEGFDPPSDAVDKRSLGSRVHHSERKKVGEDVESYPESERCGESCTTSAVTCVDQANGFKKCSGGDRVCEPKYCSVTKTRRVPRYENVDVERTYYAWSAWRWQHARNVAVEGEDVPTTWPSDEAVALGRGVVAPEKERAERRATYHVFFQDGVGKRHDYEPVTLAEFERLPRGTRKRLRIGVARSVAIVEGE